MYISGQVQDRLVQGQVRLSVMHCQFQNITYNYLGRRHFVDIIGDISWTKGVTSCGHFWRHFVDKNVHEMSPKVSTRCHPFCPRNVTYFVHEMSATPKRQFQCPKICFSLLIFGFTLQNLPQWVAATTPLQCTVLRCDAAIVDCFAGCTHG